MRARAIKKDRYYLFEEQTDGGETRVLFSPVESEFKPGFRNKKHLKNTDEIQCRVLATTEEGYKAEEVYPLMREDLRFIKHEVPAKDLPLYLDIPHKTIHFENAIKAATHKETTLV